MWKVHTCKVFDWCICGPNRRALKKRSRSRLNFPRKILVLLSLSVKRFGVSCMWDFLFCFTNMPVSPTSPSNPSTKCVYLTVHSAERTGNTRKMQSPGPIERPNHWLTIILSVTIGLFTKRLQGCQQRLTSFRLLSRLNELDLCGIFSTESYFRSGCHSVKKIPHTGN